MMQLTEADIVCKAIENLMRRDDLKEVSSILVSAITSVALATNNPTGYIKAIHDDSAMLLELFDEERGQHAED